MLKKMGNQRNALIEYTKVLVINRVRATEWLVPIAEEQDWCFQLERCRAEAARPD